MPFSRKIMTFATCISGCVSRERGFFLVGESKQTRGRCVFCSAELANWKSATSIGKFAVFSRGGGLMRAFDGYVV